jgi:hypothetical protein
MTQTQTRRFTHAAMRRVYDYLAETDLGKARVAEQAMDRINAAEENIRDGLRNLDSRMRDIEQALDQDRGLNELGVLQSIPADIDRNIAVRQVFYQMLGALLLPDELAALLAGTA